MHLAFVNSYTQRALYGGQALKKKKKKLWE
jgi:hypothetical protein